jgi:ribosomal protein L6P/L9E
VISHIDGIAMENDVKIKYLGATIVEITGRRREAIASAKAAIQALIPGKQ